MIQTSIVPDGFVDGLEAVAALSSSPPPPHAVSAAATASTAPAAMNLIFIDPPRGTPSTRPGPRPGAGGMIRRRRPPTAAPCHTSPAALGRPAPFAHCPTPTPASPPAPPASARRRACTDRRDTPTARTPPPPLARSR